MREGSSRTLRDLVYVPDGSVVEEALDRTTHLGIVAHPDDLEILAYHGILACYRDSRRGFTGVVVTDGSGSVRAGPLAHLSREELTRLRADEQRRAAELGGYSAVALLGHSSAETQALESDEIDRELASLAERARPRVLYTHSLFDRHASHLAVTLRTLRALSALPKEARPETVLGVEVWGDLDWLPEAMKVRLDVGGEPGLETALLEVFDSQLVAKRYDLATVGRRLAHATFSASHDADATDRVCLAMDLTPLIGEAENPLGHVERIFEAFRSDARSRIERLLASG